jgi:hypothetical protein
MKSIQSFNDNVCVIYNKEFVCYKTNHTNDEDVICKTVELKIDPKEIHQKIKDIEHHMDAINQLCAELKPLVKELQ